jgi:uncharacterized protein YecE (DUF72 family)
MAANRWFSHYVRYFNTVEVNNSFYSLPDVSTFTKWRKDAPSEFIFAIKANRFITHMKKLKNADDALSVFLERVSNLRRSLGPILFQLPPNLKFDARRLNDFLDQLPPRKRYVLEFRDPSWVNDKVIQMLADKKVAFCIHDLLEETSNHHVTAPFVYFRFHGFNEKYRGSYPKKVLTEHAKTMAAMRAKGKDVYAYFNNDAFGYALKDAVTLKKLIAKFIH